MFYILKSAKEIIYYIQNQIFYGGYESLGVLQENRREDWRDLRHEYLNGLFTVTKFPSSVARDTEHHHYNPAIHCIR